MSRSQKEFSSSSWTAALQYVLRGLALFLPEDTDGPAEHGPPLPWSIVGVPTFRRRPRWSASAVSRQHAAADQRCPQKILCQNWLGPAKFGQTLNCDASDARCLPFRPQLCLQAVEESCFAVFLVGACDGRGGGPGAEVPLFKSCACLHHQDKCATKSPGLLLGDEWRYGACHAGRSAAHGVSQMAARLSSRMFRQFRLVCVSVLRRRGFESPPSAVSNRMYLEHIRKGHDGRRSPWKVRNNAGRQRGILRQREGCTRQTHSREEPGEAEVQVEVDVSQWVWISHARVEAPCKKRIAHVVRAFVLSGVVESSQRSGALQGLR